jgi:hypothetical protein
MMPARLKCQCLSKEYGIFGCFCAATVTLEAEGSSPFTLASRKIRRNREIDYPPAVGGAALLRFARPGAGRDGHDPQQGNLQPQPVQALLGDVLIAAFRQLVDRWILEYAELHAAKS